MGFRKKNRWRQPLTAPRPGKFQVDAINRFCWSSKEVITVECSLTDSEAAGIDTKYNEWPSGTTTTATAHILG